MSVKHPLSDEDKELCLLDLVAFGEYVIHHNEDGMATRVPPSEWPICVKLSNEKTEREEAFFASLKPWYTTDYELPSNESEAV